MSAKESNMGPLEREMFYNPLNSRVLSSTIQEWDIKSAHLQALKIIFGESDPKVIRLSNLSKEARNIEIGKMMINNPDFVKEIQRLLFLFKKEFLSQNNIKIRNIVETTKDSIILTNKIPTKTKINISGVNIDFVNKEGLYSSYIRFTKGKSIFFDNITRNYRIKGLNQNIVQSSTFVKKCIIPLLITLESAISMGQIRALKSLKSHRLAYVENDDKTIYRQLDHNNQYLYLLNNEVIESSELIKKNEINMITSPNYINYMMPLMQSIL